MNRNKIVEAALNAPQDAVRRTLTMSIRAERPDAHVVFSGVEFDEVKRFAGEGHCEVRLIDEFAQDFEASAHRGDAHRSPYYAWWEVVFRGQTFEGMQVNVAGGFSMTTVCVFVGEQAAIDEFLVAQEEFANQIEGAVLVFQDGCWRHDHQLFVEIQNSTLENIVLPDGTCEQIVSDIQNWMDSKALYEQHGVPWKRGMILVGPPGNGKTHLIKALINRFDLNALYVRGLTAQHRSDASVISSVFRRARRAAPCLLILEDLDTMITPENRSFFLNEMDGFEMNTGLLVVASANDPARLDPALVNRPSRFDRRYTFDLPGLAERARYLAFFTAQLDEQLRLSAIETGPLSEATEGFSYAYLKELVLSSMMSWIYGGKSEPFAACMSRNVEPLREQMTFESQQAPAPHREHAYPMMPDFEEESDEV